MRLPTKAWLMNGLMARLRMYWALTKSLQTGLLLVTGIAGYLSARCPTHTGEMLLAVSGSLFFAISGSTVLNMVWDRDIDAKMQRACLRPLPSGQMPAWEGLLLGLIFSITGLAWAFMLSPLYGAVVFAGWFFDVVIYTMWLKRRTPWSIIWGGLAGGMPILAGRVLGVGQIDPIGLLFTLAILLWIPTHMLTFGMKYADQYQAAGVPIFPTAYGEWITRSMIAFSTGAAALAMLLAVWHIGLPWRFFHLALWLSTGLLALTVLSVMRRSPKLNLALYKAASLYMLCSMALIMAGVMSN